eukprot:SAG31_NODE_338_length_17490_cov_7.707032_3_plen_135_part_00
MTNDNNNLNASMIAETLFRSIARRNGRLLGGSCLLEPYIGSHAPLCTAQQNMIIDDMMTQNQACSQQLAVMRSGGGWDGSDMCNCVVHIPMEVMKGAESLGALICRMHASHQNSLSEYIAGCSKMQPSLYLLTQ